MSPKGEILEVMPQELRIRHDRRAFYGGWAGEGKRKGGGEERAEPPQAPTKNAQKQTQARSPASSPKEEEEERSGGQRKKGCRIQKGWDEDPTAPDRYSVTHNGPLGAEESLEHG